MNYFSWNDHAKGIIHKLFEEDPEFYVRHQLASFNNFISCDIPQCIKEHMPLIVNNVNSKLFYSFDITRIYIIRPLKILPGSEGFKPLLPNEARLKDLNYASPLFVDYTLSLVQNETDHSTTILDTFMERKVPITKIQIMLGSMYCHLY